MSCSRFSKRDLKGLVNFFLYAPQGSSITVKGSTVVKDFKLEDVGFKLKGCRFYKYDPATGKGRRVSRHYVEMIMIDAITSHPDLFLGSKTDGAQ